MKAEKTELLSYIEENLGRMSLKTIARNIGKSVGQVEKMVYEHHGTTNTKSFTGMLTAGELARCLKVDRNSVINWIDRHKLPSVKRITRTQKTFTFIKMEEFWEWAYQNLDRVDVTKVGPYDLLPQPDWLQEEKSKQRKTTINYKQWTVLEEKKMMKLLKQGYSYDDVALLLNRTRYSIEKKYKRVKDRSTT